MECVFTLKRYIAMGPPGFADELFFDVLDLLTTTPITQQTRLHILFASIFRNLLYHVVELAIGPRQLAPRIAELQHEHSQQLDELTPLAALPGGGSGSGPSADTDWHARSRTLPHNRWRAIA